MSTWAAPLIALLATLLGCVLSSLAIALGITSRAAVEQCALGDQAVLKRVEQIFAQAQAHAIAVGLFFRLICDLAVVAGFIFWVTQVGPHGGTMTPGVSDVLIGSGISLIVLWLFGVAVPMSIAAHARRQAHRLQLRPAPRHGTRHGAPPGRRTFR